MKRIIKIYNQSIGANYTQVPTILLKGQWLRKAGFESGEYVEVQVFIKKENFLWTVEKTFSK